MHYSECRQASFTYRKGASSLRLAFLGSCLMLKPHPAKRFKEFLSLPPHLELRSDDTIDILGFLAFEIVRALTLGGLEVKRSIEEFDPPPSDKHRSASDLEDDSPSRKRLRTSENAERDLPWHGNSMPASSLFLAPPMARTALRLQHIQDAFSRMQRDWSHTRGAGMKNWRGGLVRTSISLI